jgi:hypothetical protein
MTWKNPFEGKTPQQKKDMKRRAAFGAGAHLIKNSPYTRGMQQTGSGIIGGAEAGKALGSAIKRRRDDKAKQAVAKAELEKDDPNTQRD